MKGNASTILSETGVFRITHRGWQRCYKLHSKSPVLLIPKYPNQVLVFPFTTFVNGRIFIIFKHFLPYGFLDDPGAEDQSSAEVFIF